MKDLVNTIWHNVARKVQKRVSYSEQETQDARDQAEEVRNSISDWKQTNAIPVGMGQNCCTAWYLKVSDNKKASYAFDWVVTSPEIIIDILNDDFNRFLDRSQIISKTYRAGHKYYHDIMFGHRNPALKKDDYAYFQRCIVRWKELMESQKPLVFVTIVLNEVEKRKDVLNGFNGAIPPPRNQTLEDFESVIARLKQENLNSQFLFIEQYTEADFELEITHKSKETLWIKSSVKGSNTGVQYLNDLDNELITTVFRGLN